MTMTNTKYQCGSCEQEFSKLTKDRTCPKCKSGNWVKGCIDEAEPKHTSKKLASGDKSPKHTATLYPVGRCNNCLWYYHAEDDEKTGLECPNCKTDRHLMDMPEIVRAVNSHQNLLKALKWAYKELVKDVYIGAEMEKIEQIIKQAEGE